MPRRDHDTTSGKFRQVPTDRWSRDRCERIEQDCERMAARHAARIRVVRITEDEDEQGAGSMTDEPQPTPHDAYREALAKAREAMARRLMAGKDTRPKSEAGGIWRTTIVNTDANGEPEDVDDTPNPRTVGAR